MSKKELIKAKEKEIREAEKVAAELFDATTDALPAVIQPMYEAAEDPSETGPKISDLDALNNVVEARFSAEERVKRLYRELHEIEARP